MPATIDPIAQFEEAVEYQVKAGLSHGEAVRYVANVQPHLHQDYIIAYNRAHGRERAVEHLEPVALSTPNCVAGGPSHTAFTNPIQRFEAAILNEINAGASDRSAAVRAVAVKYPEVHEAFLVAYNRKHGRGNAVAHLKPETNLMLGPESLAPFFNTPLLLAPDRAEGLTTALLEQRSDALVNGRAGVRATMSPSAPVAVVPILGMLDKRPSPFLSTIGGTATDTIREQFDAALADPSVHTVVFDVDSPGGPMSGAFELSDAIFNARSRKKIIAVVNEEMNSGAYLIASAASEIVTPEGGRLGSIGVIASHTDARQSDRMAGLHVTVFRAGEFKAKPSMHEGIDDRTRGEIERQLGDVMGMFIEKVARNRNLSREHVRSKIATGQVWFGRDAVSLGLADRIGNLADVLKRAA